MNVKTRNVNEATWKAYTVQSKLPAELTKLEEMAHNLWWWWHNDAYNMYHDIDPELFKGCQMNVLDMLRRMSYDELIELSQDESFLYRMNKVYEQYRAYMDETPDQTRPSVAY